MQELRLLQEKDLESIYPIYVHYVKKSTAIFDLVPDSFDVFKEHMMEISKTNPFYVALNDDVLIGYGYVHPAFSKEAYKYCVELTIYFKEGKHYGLPSKMLDQLEADCRKLNMRWIISCITDSNEESIAFHKKHDFTMYGALPSCGMKFDVWHGVVWLCKRLDEVKKADRSGNFYFFYGRWFGWLQVRREDRQQSYVSGRLCPYHYWDEDSFGTYRLAVIYNFER